MKQIFVASKTVLLNKVYLFGFLALMPLTFFLFVIIPVWTIPGNSLDFQLGIFSERDYILLIILSFLTSLFITMQIFIFKNAISAKDKATSLIKGGVGGYTAVTGSIFATAACSSCLFAILGFLGTGTVLTLLSYQWYIVSGAIFILLLSIYFLSKKVNGICDTCKVDIKKS